MPSEDQSAASTGDSLSSRLSYHLNWVEKLIAWLFKILILAAVFFANLWPSTAIPDGGWMLAQARWMYEHGFPVTQNWFNYPLWGEPLVNEYAFYQLVIWPLWWLDPFVLSWFHAALALTIVWLLFRLAAQYGLHPVWFLVAMVAALFLLNQRFSPRPEMTGYLAVVLMTMLLWRHRERAFDTPSEVFRLLWPLLAIQVLWVNSHSSFLLGPVLTGLWGGELWLRRAWRERALSWRMAGSWVLFTLATIAACLLTPQPLERIVLPFFHQGSKAILAYVTEMYPLHLDGDQVALFFMCSLIVLAAVTLLAFRGMSLTYATLAALFFYLSFSSARHMAMFALLILLAMISCGFFGRGVPGWLRRPSLRWLGVAWCLLFWLLPYVVLKMRVSPDSGRNLGRVWAYKELDHGHNPLRAMDWLQQNGIRDRLLHRTEIGGELQLRGMGEQCLSDTGFGKYSEHVIYEFCTLCERPGLLPQAAEAFGSGVALVSNQAYKWPVTLRQMGWRLVFYSPNGSVWMAPDTHPELPAVSREQIAQIWKAGKANGPAADRRVDFRQILHLASVGEIELALEALSALPESDRESGVFWQTAERLAFPGDPVGVRGSVIEVLEPLAAQTPDNEGARLFEARLMAHRGELKQLAETYGTPPPNALAHQELRMDLAEIRLEENAPEEALNLLADSDAFSPREGKRFWLQARAYRAMGQIEPAGRAYAEALYFYPDDKRLQDEVREFLLQQPLPFLQESLKNSLHVF